MNDKIKLIIGIAVFALFIATASFAYNLLSKSLTPQSNIDIMSERPKGEQAAGITQNGSGEGGENKDLEDRADNGNFDKNNDDAGEEMKAPDFTVLDSGGNSVKLSDMFGKPIVLNFWASWCPPCKSEMPEFDKVYGEIGDKVTFMMVDLVDGQRETKAKGETYASEQGFSFPVYYDVDQEAVYTYGISSIPTTLFIDKDGYIITGAQGSISEETLWKGICFIREDGE